MHISQITLRDWKTYTSAVFDFPEPINGKNIILIGAPNGFGKTNLFEAILLGLYGRFGLTLIARSPFSEPGEEKLSTTYKKFLEKALHRGAIESGRQSCSVKLVFIDDNGSPLEIQRTWHFNNSGIFLPNDEEIHIFEGKNRKAIGPTNLFGLDCDVWYQDYIAKNLLPYTMAHFYMFDGEQVSVLAEREMSAQVRTGIEGMLGIPVLKQLAIDLRTYAEQQRRLTPNVSDQTIDKMEEEYLLLTSEFDTKKERLTEIEPIVFKLKKEQENLIRELGGFGVSSQALLQEQFEKIKNYQRNIEDGYDQLEFLMVNKLAIALSGHFLRENVKKRLKSEGILERWQTSKKQGDSNLERFLSSVSKALNTINPSLSNGQHQDVLRSARSSWDKLWHPPPENCAQEYLHQCIREPERSKVVDYLEEVDRLGAPTIIELLDKIATNEQQLKRQQDEVIRIESIAPHVDNKRKQLENILDKIRQFDKEITIIQRDLEALDAQINQKKVDLSKQHKNRVQAVPSARRSASAKKVALMIDDIVKKTVPSQIEALADYMTKAHRLMAHKKDLVNHIEINQNCEVKLLNAEGLDLRSFDLSAGEKQIFTQSLISAVASISNRTFPMIIDTPLGRLDIEHRKGVLKHLIQRNHQIILLSTNTEVVGEYYKLVTPHVQKKYLVHFERVGEIGQSSISHGYFEI